MKNLHLLLRYTSKFLNIYIIFFKSILNVTHTNSTLICTSIRRINIDQDYNRKVSDKYLLVGLIRKAMQPSDVSD